MVKTYKQLIDAWPSLTTFADDLSVDYNTAKKMRSRDRVHSSHWRAMVSAAATRGISGVTLEVLAEIDASRLASARPKVPDQHVVFQ